jgi:hypothetical protein
VDLKFRVRVLIFDVRRGPVVDRASLDTYQRSMSHRFQLYKSAWYGILHWRAFNRICLKDVSVGLMVISVQPCVELGMSTASY